MRYFGVSVPLVAGVVYLPLTLQWKAIFNSHPLYLQSVNDGFWQLFILQMPDLLDQNGSVAKNGGQLLMENKTFRCQDWNMKFELLNLLPETPSGRYLLILITI